MKFLCVECDQQMAFSERQLPGDGTLAATFKCPKCGRVVAMLTNPMETQLVSSLGVEIGGRTVPVEPLEMVGEIRVGASPVPDHEAEPGDGEQDQQHQELASRVGRHGATIPRRHTAD